MGVITYMVNKMEMTQQPNLQKRLEQDGWTFLTNMGLNEDYITQPDPTGKGYPRQVTINRFIPKTDADIRSEFSGMGFKDILIQDAYNIHDEFIDNMRAVYVKKE